MPLEIPSRSDVTSSLQAYVRSSLPDLDPTVTRRRGFIGGMVRSLASALHDWYVKLKRYADHEPHPQTASASFLKSGWWVDVTKLEPNAAAAARGTLVITGTAGSLVSAGEELAIGAITFAVDSSSAVLSQGLNITSLTRSGTMAIAETATAHLLATGMTLTIINADQAEYNGSVVITVTNDNEFTYTVAGSPATPATTGSVIKATGVWGNVNVTATATGSDTNVDAAAALTFSVAPSGVDSEALVTFGGLGGGADIEDIESYRTRLLEALGTDFGMFSAAEIKIVAKQLAGVTRVWVIEPTEDGSNGVLPGQVKIYFMRDNDADPFPSSTEVAALKAHIVTEIMPAHTAEDDVMVFKPTKLVVDVTFATLVPDTASMRQAIQARLEQLFDEGVEFGTDVTEDAYRCAIYGTYDPERKETLRSFTLTTPTGDITVASDELAVLGGITWPT